MTPLLLIHIAAGSTAIASGALALVLRKGGARHRLAGRVFAIAMLAMAGLGIVLALTMAPGKGAAPPQASIAVAGLTLYLVVTAWLTMRPQRRFDRSAMLAVFAIAVVLAVLGVRAVWLHLLAAPYFVFAAIAVLAGVLDIRFLRSGKGRLARHLWRMCTALFFATAFFFIGQQKVMPNSWHGSPVLILLAVAPLAAMIWWLVRVQQPQAQKEKAGGTAC